MSDDVKQAVMRAICQERCAFMGQPACWQLDEADGGPYPFPPEDCDSPGCEALAEAALTAWNRRAGPAWQPIATAPRDGTWFMIIKADEGAESVEVGKYEPLMFPRYEAADGGLYRRVDELGYEWCGFNNFHRATHWRPLPSPPEGGE